MINKLEGQSIAFELYQDGIDHSMLPSAMLRQDGFTVDDIEVIDPGEPYSIPTPQYVTEKDLLSYVSMHQVSTVVLDIPVGRGKTTSCYDLIKHYTNDDTNVIIVVSPFKKLVEKDYDALVERQIEAFHYESLSQVSLKDAPAIVEDALHKQVHVMTFNCLLQNPGENRFDQRASKVMYMDGLLRFCTDNNKNVIMFFDELHESVTYFKPLFVPNMIKWTGVTKHCFVSSATFTPACYPLIKYIAAMTRCTIVNVYYERARWAKDKRANMHLHIIDEEYSSNRLAPLSCMFDVLNNSQGKQVNILSASKSLIESFGKKTINEVANPFYDLYRQWSFNEVTADTDNEFNATGNNIGTTFKTGVNIINSNSVFIIILPVITQDRSHRGIFSDGYPAIVQALARLRNGGDAHIFMYTPDILFEVNRERFFLLDDEIVPLTDVNDSYRAVTNRVDQSLMDDMKTEIKRKGQIDGIFDLKERYEAQLRCVSPELAYIDALQAGGLNLGYTYPSFEDFILGSGLAALINTDSQYGGDLSSLMLWACLHNQFVSADLTNITFYSRRVETITISKDKFKEQIGDYLPTGMLEAIKNLRLRSAFEVLSYSIETGLTPPDGENNTMRKYIIDGKTYSFSLLKTQPWFIKDIVLLWTNAKGLSVTKDTLRDTYLLDSMCQAMWDKSNNQSPLKDAYKKLYDICADFVNYCNGRIEYTARDKKPIVHLDNAVANLPDNIVYDAKAVVTALKQHDPLIRAKGISFFQTLGKKSAADDKGLIYTTFRDLFTNISGKENDRYGVGNKWYLVNGKIDKTLPQTPNLYLF